MNRLCSLRYHEKHLEKIRKSPIGKYAIKYVHSRGEFEVREEEIGHISPMIFYAPDATSVMLIKTGGYTSDEIHDATGVLSKWLAEEVL